MPFRVIIQSFSLPEENLSAEEYLYHKKNEDSQEEILRIWESEVFFVVLGSSLRVSEEVFFENCKNFGVPVLRRCSAGGAILQGPGCINFSLVLCLERFPHLRNIRESYHFILSSIGKTLYNNWKIETTIEGICDLCYKGKKISGNAQRRNNKVLLHHGTILYRVDYELMENVLQIPKVQPEYRAGKKHSDFVGYLPLTRDEIIDCIIETFALDGYLSSFTDKEIEGIRNLAENKYSKDEWNYKR